jgi:hypothetical protein
MDWENDLVLRIWQARNLLSGIEIFPYTNEKLNTLAEVEDILLNRILRIVAKHESLDRPGSV